MSTRTQPKKSRKKKNKKNPSTCFQMAGSLSAPNPLLMKPPRLQSRQIQSTSSFDDDSKEESRSKEEADKKRKQKNRRTSFTMSELKMHESQTSSIFNEENEQKPPIEKEKEKVEDSYEKQPYPLPSSLTTQNDKNDDLVTALSEKRQNEELPHHEPKDAKPLDSPLFEVETVEGSSLQDEMDSTLQSKNESIELEKVDHEDTDKSDSVTTTNKENQDNSDASLQKDKAKTENDHIIQSNEPPAKDRTLVDTGSTSDSQLNKLVLQKKVKPFLQPDLPAQPTTPTVLLPVLVSQLTVNIDLVQSITLPTTPDKITNVEWSSQSLECDSISRASTAFLKGQFLVMIEFASNDSLYIVNTPITWSKTMKIDWCYPPVEPIANSNKQAFYNNSQIVHEQSNTFSEPIYPRLTTQHFVSQKKHEMFETNVLDIQGSATLSIDLLQQQYVPWGK